jgi:hypothetical protein
VAGLFGALVLVPRWIYPPLSSTDLQGVVDPRSRIELQQAQSRLANDARAAMLQALAGFLVALGAAATWRQVHISREGQITERFTKAVEALGSQNIDVRVGGIYALERIAKNSPADRNPVQFLLGAYVRNHSAWPVGTPTGPQHPTEKIDTTLPWMRVRAPDVQAAMAVLGRRPPVPDPQSLYLSRVDLRSVALRGAQLANAHFRYANLARAALVEVDLNGGDLVGADLRQANLERARLSRANLSRAYLQGANLCGADLRDADLRDADLRGTNLKEAEFDGSRLTGAKADRTTRLPAELDAALRNELRFVEIAADENSTATVHQRERRHCWWNLRRIVCGPRRPRKPWSSGSH